MTTLAANPAEVDAAPYREMTSFWSACRAICRLVVTLCFDLKAYGTHNVPMTGGVLFVSNHQSYLDPVLLGVLLRRPMSYMAKSELFKNRYVGWLIRNLKAFPVNRTGSATSAMKEAIRQLNTGRMLNVFPEGTRSRDGELRPIESGISLILRRVEVPVIPVAIDGSFEAWPRWRKIFRPHPIQMMYGPPLDLKGLDSKQITQLIDRTLRTMIAELRQRREGIWRKPVPPAGWVDKKD